MLRRMTWTQFMAWRDYAELEPFGPHHEDLRAGIVAATIANVHRDPKRRARPYSPADFMPGLERRAAAQPLTDPERWRSIKATARNLAAAREGR